METSLDEQTAVYPHRPTKDVVAAFIRTADHLIIGAIHVRPGSRLTDELNNDIAPFLAINDAHVYDAHTEQLSYITSVQLVAYRSIILIGESDSLVTIRPVPWHVGSSEPIERDFDPLGGETGLRIDEKGKFFSARVPKDAVHVLITTDDLSLVGAMYVRPERRLRDELNDARSRFLPLTDARAYDQQRSLRYHASFLLAAYHQMQTIIPTDALTDAASLAWIATGAEEPRL